MATTPVPTPQKVNNILAIIDAALKGLTMVPAIGLPAGLADIFLNILRGGLSAYQAEVGAPLDLSKLHFEQPLP